MPQDLSGTSFEDFLKKQLEPLPPTPREIQMTENPHTSAVDAPPVP